MMRFYPVYPDLDIASRHSKLLDILSVLVAETSDEDEGAVGVKVSSNVDEHGTTKISAAPKDLTDVVKNDA